VILKPHHIIKGKPWMLLVSWFQHDSKVNKPEEEPVWIQESWPELGSRMRCCRIVLHIGRRTSCLIIHCCICTMLATVHVSVCAGAVLVLRSSTTLPSTNYLSYQKQVFCPSPMCLTIFCNACCHTDTIHFQVPVSSKEEFDRTNV